MKNTTKSKKKSRPSKRASRAKNREVKEPRIAATRAIITRASFCSSSPPLRPRFRLRIRFRAAIAPPASSSSSSSRIIRPGARSRFKGGLMGLRRGGEPRLRAPWMARLWSFNCAEGIVFRAGIPRSECGRELLARSRFNWPWCIFDKWRFNLWIDHLLKNYFEID